MNQKSYAKIGVLISLSILFICGAQFAKAQQFEWAYGSGQWTDDEVRGTTTDLEGNVYFTGYSSSGAKFGTYTMPTWGMYLVKLSPAGAILWVKQSIESFDTRSTSVITDSKNNVYVTGWYVHGITIEGTYLPGALQPRMFVVKYTSAGQLSWVRHFGTLSDIHETYGSDIAIDQFDHIYITGRFTGTIEFDHITLTIHKESDSYWYNDEMYLLKLTSEGKVDWAYSAGGKYNDIGMDLAIDKSTSSIYLSGNFTPYKASFGNIIQDANTSDPIPFIAKYNYQGQAQWVTSLRGGGAEIVDLAIDYQGNFYATGVVLQDRDYQLGNTLIKGADTKEFPHYNFVTKVDASGNVIWVKKFGFEDPSYAYYSTDRPVISDKEGNFYLAGTFRKSMLLDDYTLNSTPTPEGNLYTTDIFVAKFNSIGYTQWIKQVGGPHREAPTCITLDPQNNVIIGGVYVSAELNFDANIIKNNSGNNDEDFFIAKLSNPDVPKCPQSSVSIEAPSRFCEGDSLSISSKIVNGFSYQWLKNGIPVSVLYKETLITKEAGTFQLVINPHTACSDTSTAVSISQIKRPLVDLTIVNDTILCQDEISIIEVPYNPQYTYQWYKDGTAIDGKNVNSMQVSEKGDYQVKVKNESFCEKWSKIQKITVVPKQVDFLLDTLYVCAQQPGLIKPETTDFYGSMQWSTDSETESIEVIEPGQYWLKLKTLKCEYIDTVTVVSYQPMLIPNVFTPNGDNINDTFVVKNILPNTYLEVHNRLGKQVYKSINYQNNWNGENLTNGIYFYVIQSNNPCAQPKFAKGLISILR